MTGALTSATALLTEAVGDEAGRWDLAGRLPVEVARHVGAAGLLCATVPAEYGGQAMTWDDNGELTARLGALCSSLRSLMTSQGIAAEAIRRSGDAGQRKEFLTRLVDGQLAAVAFSEAEAGSDLAAMRTRIHRDGEDVVVDGSKVWVTGAAYADLLVVFGRYGDGAAAVVVPADAPGVTIEPVPDPLGCRAAGHAMIGLDRVRVGPANLLGGAGQPLSFLITGPLTYGRLSVAWGCAGILRACLDAAVRHSRVREQFGAPLARHQLVRRHLAGLLTDERTATRVAEHAARCWDAHSPELVTAAVLAKHVAATGAARGAATAVQVLASAGAEDGHVVARAYRDAKLMEIIEGSNEICELLLAEEALAGRS